MPRSGTEDGYLEGFCHLYAMRHLELCKDLEMFSRSQRKERFLMITQLARPDGLALRAGRPRALGIGRTKDSKSECDERAYTYQQGD